MSLYYSAKLVYGVLLTPDEVATASERSDWDDICDNWIYNADGISGDGDKVLGIVEDSIEVGEATELGTTIHDPRSADIDALLEVLDDLGILREPV